MSLKSATTMSDLFPLSRILSLVIVLDSSLWISITCSAPAFASPIAQAWPIPLVAPLIFIIDRLMI